jgi:hypothetical protein
MKSFFWVLFFYLVLVMIQSCSQTVMPQKNNHHQVKRSCLQGNRSSSSEMTRADSLRFNVDPCIRASFYFFENEESNKQVLVKGVITRFISR